MLLRLLFMLGLGCILVLSSQGTSHARGVSAVPNEARPQVGPAALETSQNAVIEESTVPEPDSGPQYARGTQTLSYGFFELIEGEPFAVRDETWTFDHGGDPLEGWRSKDLTAGDTQNAFRRITTTDWDANNPVAAPIPSGSGAAWVGLYQNEAGDAGWSGGLGYGHSWCHHFTSPPLTYNGSGDVELSFDYFNDTESGFDFTRVRLLLEDGTDTVLHTFTGTDGNPGSSTYVPFNQTITSAEFEGQTGFQIVFELSSDESFDDEDGFYNTTYGPFSVDDISLTGNLVDGDEFWDFEADDHGFVATQCGQIGDFFGVEDFSTYGIECDALSGFVAEIHNDDLYHPDGQYAYLYSPAVDISSLQPDSVYMQFDIYADMPQIDGVFLRPGWEYYPSESGGSEWSDRVDDGVNAWRFFGNDPYCGPVNPGTSAYALPDAVPDEAQWIRMILELRSDPVGFGLPPCTVEPCNGNASPLIDNIAILVEVPSESGSIAGSVFEDVEGDCIPDTGGSITDRYVLLDDLGGPRDRLSGVQSDGSYSFEFVEPGSYEVSLLDAPYWVQTCPASPDTTYIVELTSGDAITGNDFGTDPVPDIVDVTPSIGSTRARPGFGYVYEVEVRNVGTTTTDAVNVVLQLPANVEYEQSVPEGVFTPSGGGSGDPIGSVAWDTAGLDPEAIDRFAVKLRVLETVPLGTELSATASVSTPDDADLTNDDADATTEVIGSFDPNDKHVGPVGEIAPDQLLDYHVNFQNVGTASAINIVVRDTLDANLDISTFAIGAASHDYTFEILGRELVWTFEGIELPDSTSDEPGSHGFVEFTILPVADLAAGTEITNRAGIYFDFNEVVLTNTVVSTIQDPSDAPEAGGIGAASLQLRSIAPNPSNGETALRLAVSEPGRLSAVVYAVDGRRVRTLADERVVAGSTDLTWDGRTNRGTAVAGGIYFVRMRLEGDAGSTTELEARVVRIE